MRKSNKIYSIGLILFLFGGAGLAEVITSDRGSFLISTIVFAAGIGFIMASYVVKDRRSKYENTNH